MIHQDRQDRRPKLNGRLPVKTLSIAAAVVVCIAVVALLFYQGFFLSLAFQMSRIKNTFSYYVLKEKPQFYYLDVEKNGQDMRIYRNDVLEITYRDEVVVKAVASDDLSGKYTYVRFEGLSSRSSDLGVLMKGIDFVNKLIHPAISSCREQNS